MYVGKSFLFFSKAVHSALGIVSVRWLGFERAGGDMFVLALVLVLQIYVLCFKGMLYFWRLSLERVDGDRISW